MANKDKQRSTPAPDPEVPAAEAQPTETSAQPAPITDAAAKEAEEAPAVEVAPPTKADVTVLPDPEPQLTAERAFSGARVDPIVGAFLHVERLRPEGVRKLSQQAWQDELAAFKRAPR